MDRGNWRATVYRVTKSGTQLSNLPHSLTPGVKIPHSSRAKNQNIKQKQYYNKLNKDFKNGSH